MRVFVPLLARELPATKHVEVFTHETLLSMASGLGPAIGAQILPFHCAAFAPPTARQFVVLRHDTAPPPALGIFDQVLPFQRVVRLPTAMQYVALTHDTPNVTVSAVLTDVGAMTTDQVLPFQCSSKAWLGRSDAT